MQALFLELVDLSPEDRAARLEGLGHDAAHIGEQVARMLACDDDLEQEEAPPVVPEFIGPYRLVRRIGAGGMAVVFLAERTIEDVTTKVALKLLPYGADTLVERFRAERRILSSLEHPHIARFLDAGATEDGRPYLVMEYVQGVPIDEYVRRHDLSMDARVELLMQVCEAAHHAHQRLIVHRDIKPCNVLVDVKGDCKLLDFGVAKVLRSTDADALTSPTSPAGLTPAYASPEQITGGEVTTASDVFALGAVLFEVLSEVRFADAVTERGPPRPSRAAAKASRRRRLRGDLDTIVVKATQPEPHDRYPTALSLFEDLDRHRRRMPIRAMAPSPVYLAERLVRRHPWSSGLILTLGVATLTLLISLVMQTRSLEQKRWESEFTRATLSAALVELAHNVSPVVTTELERVLDERALEVRARLQDSPKAQGALLRSFGDLHRYMDKTHKAIKLYQSAFTVQRAALGLEHPETARTAMLLAACHLFLGRFERAAAMGELSLRSHEASLGTDDAATARAYNLVCGVHANKRDYARARPYCLKAYQIRSRVLPADHPNIAQSLYNLGSLDVRSGNADAGLALLERSLQARFRDPGATSPRVAELEIVRALAQLGRLSEAVARLDRAFRTLDDEPKPIVRQMAYNTRARVRLRAHQAQQALRDLEMAARSRPDDGNYPWLRLEIEELAAASYTQLGDLSHAAEARARAQALAQQLEIPLNEPTARLGTSPR